MVVKNNEVLIEKIETKNAALDKIIFIVDLYNVE